MIFIHKNGIKYITTARYHLSSNGTANDEEKFTESEISKSLRIFCPGDQVWLRSYMRGEKWIKGTIISKVSTVMYKVTCCDEIYEEHMNQLRF